MKNYWQLLRGLNRDMRLYLLADGLSGFTVDGGIYAVVLNLYLLRLGYGVQFIGAVNGAGVLAYGLFSLAAVTTHPNLLPNSEGRSAGVLSGSGKPHLFASTTAAPSSHSARLFVST